MKMNKIIYIINRFITDYLSVYNNINYKYMSYKANDYDIDKTIVLSITPSFGGTIKPEIDNSIKSYYKKVYNDYYIFDNDGVLSMSLSTTNEVISIMHYLMDKAKDIQQLNYSINYIIEDEKKLYKGNPSSYYKSMLEEYRDPFREKHLSHLGSVLDCLFKELNIKEFFTLKHSLGIHANINELQLLIEINDEDGITIIKLYNPTISMMYIWVLN